MTDYTKLCEDLTAALLNERLSRKTFEMWVSVCDAIESLQAYAAEKDKRITELEAQLDEFSAFLCDMTGGRMSKTNYSAQTMISQANDYQQEQCEKCDMVFHVDKDLVKRWKAEALEACARLQAERDAAVEDLDKLRACSTCSYADQYMRSDRCSTCRIDIESVYHPAILYFTKGWGKRFFHDVMNWHRPSDWKSDRYYDTCKYCGKKIMQDSQGNWFEFYDGAKKGSKHGQ